MSHQIDYAFEFESKEIHIVILKENRKHKIQWKFLPLFSIDIFDTKIVANTENLVTQRSLNKLSSKSGSEEVQLPIIVETKILSKKAD